MKQRGKNMNNKLKTLQAIINGAGFKFVYVQDYDFTQPDAMDESGSGGVWDLAGEISALCLDRVSTLDTDTDDYNYTKSYLQSLLYNLMCSYKDEINED